ncbi:MAG: DUF2339 domain-containing protein [bacterium]|nr:DUF2339 domain-containing protein [bacterium]
MEFIAIIILFVLIVRLQGKVRKLELKSKLPQSQAVEPILQTPPATPSFQPTAEPRVITEIAPASTLSKEPGWTTRFGAWIKEDWILKLGALLLLIGFGWLTTYAFLNNWIGPMGRITLGIIAGALILIFGWWRMQKYLHQGSIFLVLGSTVILLTIFAAREFYGFFTPLIALIAMLLSTTFVAIASVKYKTRTLALLSLILAGAAPLLTNSVNPSYVGLFSYLFVICLGAIWIVALTGWRALTPASLIIVTLYSLPHLTSYVKGEKETLLLFSFAFAALFFVTNTLGILKLRGKELVPDLVATGGTGLFLLAWITYAAPTEWHSLLIAAWMIIFSVGAFMLWRATGQKEPFYIYAGVGIVMLAAATAAELSGATLTIAYTLETALVTLGTYFIVRNVHVAETTSLLMAIPIFLSLSSADSNAWQTSIIHKDFFVLLILALTLLGLGKFFLAKYKENNLVNIGGITSAHLIVGSIYVYGILWLSLHAKIVNNDTAAMIALVTYTIIGVITYFYGRTNSQKLVRLYGGIMLGFVVGRLLIIDIWNMAIAGKIITFFLIGALLMGTAFIGRKKKEEIVTPN